MGFLTVTAADPAPARGPIDDFWYDTNIGGAVAGQAITPANALQVGSVYASLHVLADTIAQLPLDVLTRDGAGDTVEVEGHPVARIFNRQANHWQTGFEFKRLTIAQAVLRGNAYARIHPGPGGPVDSMEPLHPDRVRPERVANGRIVYRINRDAGGIETLNQDDVWHIRNVELTTDGISGLDTLRQAMRSAVGMAAAGQDYGARFFENDARPGAVIQREGHFENAEARRKFLESVRTGYSGAKRFRAMLLEDGMKFDTVSVNNEQAQFLQTRVHQDVDVARFLRVQPHKIGILDRATFSNIEQQALEFISDTLMPWLVMIEQSINANLLIDPLLFAKFNVNALARGDLLSRYKAYAVGRNWGWLSVNDVLRMEDMNGIGAEGNIRLVPLNTVPAGTEFPRDGDKAEDAATPPANVKGGAAPGGQGKANGHA